MLSWLQRTLRSSIGKKVLMACTGLGLIGFLIGHLAGNLTLFADSEGEAFTHYATTLNSNPALPVVEVGLTLLFLAHIVLAFKVTRENREARGKGYTLRNDHGARTPGSRSMMITGVLILAFIVVHLIDFRFDKPELEEMSLLAGMVESRLSGTVGFLIYFGAMVPLTLHLSHAFQSALQTLGLNHPKYNCLIKVVGRGLALIIGLGFASFPLAYFFGGNA
ncbi:MAG: succinate dehydrogenase cytochrome b subunit [Planctomycetes bacterium]|nr:succinate dehydrogenase cytochrome b subunit [Planctomycetota bacterium]MCB9904004.1 succinate dehydrogenase cytochrome b subunit [Planctomycetota bacterium]